MRGAAQRFGVAVALQEIPAGRRGLRLVDVEFRRQFGIARLQRGMHQVAAGDRDILAPAEGDGDMSGRVAGRRQDADVVAACI